MEHKNLSFKLMITSNLMKRYLDNNANMRYAEKYTGNNIWILGYLFHNSDHDVFQKDLEEAFSVRRSTISKAVKLMVQKGLITREPVEYDARLKKLVLTEKSKQISEIIITQMKEVEEKFLGCLTDDEASQLSEILGKIQKNFLDCPDLMDCGLNSKSSDSLNNNSKGD